MKYALFHHMNRYLLGFVAVALVVSACNTARQGIAPTAEVTYIPSLSTTSTAPPPVYLSSLPIAYMGTERLGIGTVANTLNPDYGNPISAHGFTYDHGLNAFGPMRLDYELSGKFGTFVTDILLNDQHEPCGDGAEFRILINDKEAYVSPLIDTDSYPQKVELDVSEAQWLTLMVYTGETWDCYDAIWGDPYLVTKTAGAAVPTIQRVRLVTQDGKQEVVDSDSLRAELPAGDSAVDGLEYRWYRNDVLIKSNSDPTLSNIEMKTFSGIPREKTPASDHTDHTIRGYTYRMEVYSPQGELLGRDEVVIGGPVYPEANMRGISLPDQFKARTESPLALGSLDRLARTIRPNWVVFYNNYFIDDINSTDIFEKLEEGSSDVIDSIQTTTSLEKLGDLIDRAHELGIKVMYAPEVQTLHGRGREQVSPTAEWFASYQEFITAQASFAQEHGVELFSVGEELDTTTSHEFEWRQAVDAVRQVYRGKLIYKANFPDTPGRVRGEKWDITWWEAVDYIGANFNINWYVHAQTADPAVAELKNLYRPYVNMLQEISVENNKPVIISETGVHGFVGALGGSFWNVPENSWDPSGACVKNHLPWDTQGQSDYVEAMMEIISERDFIVGVFWDNWELATDWRAFDEADQQCGNILMYRPMERVITSWYGSD